MSVRTVVLTVDTSVEEDVQALDALLTGPSSISQDIQATQEMEDGILLPSEAGGSTS